jgi:UDP-glucose 6-dehydrogenase
MQKYVHNLFNAAKVTFFNEMRQLADNIGANADTIFKVTALSCEVMWNPMYGLKNKGPFTGSCLPKDTKALYAWAKKNGF